MNLDFKSTINKMNLKNLMLKICLPTSCLLSTVVYSQQGIVYPPTHKSTVEDVYFETNVPDPYRWLESDNAPETIEWVKQQNTVTSNYLATIPFRDTLKARMTALWNYAKYTPPFRAGSRYFYYKNDGLQNQPILFMMKSLQYVPMSYFDPNKISDDGTTAITQTVPSKDGRYMVFVLSNAGSDWNEVRIKEVSNMKTLPDKLGWVKFSNIAWKDSGFYYSRYETPRGDANVYTDKNQNHKVYYHQLNTPQESDSLIFSDSNQPLRTYSASTTEDERFLVISGAESTSGNNILIKDLQTPNAKLAEVVKTFDADFELIGNVGENLIFLTNFKAPRKKLVMINSRNFEMQNWKDLVAEKTDILKTAKFAGGKLVLNYMKDASSHLYIYSVSGKMESEIPLGNLGTVDAINSSNADTLIFFSFTTFTAPATIYRFNIRNNKLYEHAKPRLPFKSDDYETKQVFYLSKDGTKIPLFIVHKKGLVPDGKAPTLLFGYGGFDISKTPEFKPERMVFLEQGGIFAMANLRGGGEYGEEWHMAGTKLKKQNVFDDFIAAAEYLIKNNYTNPSKLAISGRSNGGLLVGAVMTQRPDLFKVALPAVGVMDMLRYHKFTIGWSWATDYGTSDNEEEFKALYKYSPIHNIKSGVSYPATLVTTADHDDRVVPAHSFKFISTLQEKQKGDNPVLIRIDTKAGHGAGKPTGKLIDEQADIFTFMFYNLGMKY